MLIGYAFKVAVLDQRVDMVLNAGTRVEADCVGDLGACRSVPVALHVGDEEFQNA
jgi:hypothetical protein